MSSLIIFLSIVLFIYGLANYYIWVRTSQALIDFPVIRWVVLIILLLLILAYPISRFIPTSDPGSIIEIIHLAGSLWLGAMLYLVLMLGILDIIRWLHGLILQDYNWLKIDLSHIKLSAFMFITLLTTIILLLGSINARNPVVKHLTIDLPRHSQAPSFRIAAVSDIHMGRIIGKKQVNHLVMLMNETKPDLVLMVGDMIDDEIGPVISADLGASLNKLQAPMGVYAVTGNHEYIGDHAEALNYLEQKGIRLLRDQALRLPNGLWLIGREDRDMIRFTGTPRQSLRDILSSVSQHEPIILLDHQPYELTEKAEAGVFLSLSGHTHHGQMWPLNLLTKKIFGLSHGYKKIGGMHAYVSSGYGSWGPPVRIGNRPEIVIIDLIRPSS